MRLVERRPLTLALPWAACLLFIALLAACGGGEEDGVNGDSGNGASIAEAVASPRPATTDESNTTDDPGDGPLQTSAFETSREPSPDDILLALPRESDNVLYVDVQEAIKALDNHREVRSELKSEWDKWGLSEAFDIDVADLDYIAFGDFGGGDTDLFLLGGVDTDGLRDTLDDSEFLESELGSLEVWLGGTQDPVIAIFLGEDTVLVPLPYAVAPLWFMQQLVSRLTQGYPVASDLLRAVTSEKEDLEDAVELIAGNPGAAWAILAYLSETVESEFDDHPPFIQWVRGDLLVRFAGEEDADDAFSDWVDREVGISIVLAQWLAQEKGAAEDLVRWLAGDEGTIEGAARSLAEQKSGSFTTRNGDTYAVVGPYGQEMELHLGPVGQDESFSMVLNWLNGNEQAMSDVWRSIGDETREIANGVLTTIMDDSVSLHDDASDFWGSLSPGIAKQMVICGPSSDDCTFFGQSMSKETDQEFRWASLLEFKGADQASEELEDVEEDQIHDSCGTATFELDGNRIRGEAVCEVGALADILRQGR